MNAPTQQCRSVVGAPDHSDDPGIEHLLWTQLADASRCGSAHHIAVAEDAIFRHYLPWAQSLAAAASPRHPKVSTIADYREAAELGLAQAILAGRRSGHGHFTDFARRLILRRLRLLPAGINDRRVYDASRMPCEIPFEAVVAVNHDRAVTQPPSESLVARRTASAGTTC